MSYDLTFWHQRPDADLDPETVYLALCEGRAVEGLLDLPVTQMLDDIAAAFADWERLDAVTFEHPTRGAFQIDATPQSLRIDGYGMEGEDMNRFIDIASRYQCPLYDPQVNRRFSL